MSKRARYRTDRGIATWFCKKHPQEFLQYAPTASRKVPQRGPSVLCRACMAEKWKKVKRDAADLAHHWSG